MAYIGRGTESISNVEILDNLTFNGSASYTLQKSSVNFVPSSANNLLISISGVVQQGNFSVSGSTITFDTTVSASDTCDWILHYGTGLITTVADGAITEAKLGSNAVTTAKINNGAITSAKLDSGLLPTNTPAFHAYIDGTNTISDDTWTKVTFAAELFDTDGCYDNVTNYRFTPTVAGKYFVYCTLIGNASNVGLLREIYIQLYKNGSGYTMLSEENLNTGFDEYRRTANGCCIVDMNGSTDYLEVFTYLNNTSGSPQYSGSGVKGTSFGAYKLIGA